MSTPGDVTEDRGLKALFAAYPMETVEVFVPELLEQQSRPSTVEVVQQESQLPDLGDPSRFLDIALRCAWADGSEAVIVLVEHWSSARHVDLRRVLWYVADLALRYPQAAVMPVILVTDLAGRDVSGRLEMTIAGMTTLTLDARVTQVGPDDLPRLRQLQNRVAAMLTALAMHDVVEAAVGALAAMAAAPGPLDDLRRFLPLAMKLARMRDTDEPRFRAMLKERPDMGNVIEELMEEAKAKGVAAGQVTGAQATIDTILRLVSDGVLPVGAALAQVKALMAAGVIPKDIGQGALRELN